MSCELTFTTTLSVFTQPFPSVPVTTYVVVPGGVAVVVALFGAESQVEGDHEYVFAPVAVKVAWPLKHIETSLPALTGGSGLTVTVTCAVSVQALPSVPVTVYVAVATGVNATPSVTPPVQL
jgi:hypothetical protein